jgi:hypothetical protein
VEKDLGKNLFHSCLLLEGSRSIYVRKKTMEGIDRPAPRPGATLAPRGLPVRRPRYRRFRPSARPQTGSALRHALAFDWFALPIEIASTCPWRSARKAKKENDRFDCCFLRVVNRKKRKKYTWEDRKGSTNLHGARIGRNHRGNRSLQVTKKERNLESLVQIGIG